MGAHSVFLLYTLLPEQHNNSQAPGFSGEGVFGL
jgi:hypothetical protein